MMQARTAFRLAMLDNGYWPLLNDCKKAIVTGWPKRRPDRDEVLSWDRSALASTGMKIDGDLAVIDADIADAGLVAALAAALDERFPALFRNGLVRHTGGSKDASMSRSGGSPRAAGTAAAMIRTILRWPSTWWSASARSGRGSSP
jgi:hypothetical protein